jgi:hypothetical protein
VSALNRYLNTETGEIESLTDLPGEQHIPVSRKDRVDVVDQDGKIFNVPLASAKQAIDAGYRFAGAKESRFEGLKQEAEAEPLGQVRAGAGALISGAVPFVGRALLGEEGLAAAAAYPATDALGEIAGAVGPALLTGGASAIGAGARAIPAAKIAMGAERVGAAVAGKTGSRVLGTAVTGAVEGAAIAGLDTAGRQVAAGEPIDAEAIATAMAWGGGLGGVGGGLFGLGAKGVGKLIGERSKEALDTNKLVPVLNDLEENLDPRVFDTSETGVFRGVKTDLKPSQKAQAEKLRLAVEDFNKAVNAKRPADAATGLGLDDVTMPPPDKLRSKTRNVAAPTVPTERVGEGPPLLEPDEALGKSRVPFRASREPALGKRDGRFFPEVDPLAGPPGLDEGVEGTLKTPFVRKSTEPRPPQEVLPFERVSGGQGGLFRDPPEVTAPVEFNPDMEKVELARQYMGYLQRAGKGHGHSTGKRLGPEIDDKLKALIDTDEELASFLGQTGKPTTPKKAQDFLAAIKKDPEALQELLERRRTLALDVLENDPGRLNQTSPPIIRGRFRDAFKDIDPAQLSPNDAKRMAQQDAFFDLIEEAKLARPGQSTRGAASRPAQVADDFVDVAGDGRPYDALEGLPPVRPEPEVPPLDLGDDVPFNAFAGTKLRSPDAVPPVDVAGTGQPFDPNDGMPWKMGDDLGDLGQGYRPFTMNEAAEHFSDPAILQKAINLQAEYVKMAMELDPKLGRAMAGGNLAKLAQIAPEIAAAYDILSDGSPGALSLGLGAKLLKSQIGKFASGGAPALAANWGRKVIGAAVTGNGFVESSAKSFLGGAVYRHVVGLARGIRKAQIKKAVSEHVLKRREAIKKGILSLGRNVGRTSPLVIGQAVSREQAKKEIEAVHFAAANMQQTQQQIHDNLTAIREIDLLLADKVEMASMLELQIMAENAPKLPDLGAWGRADRAQYSDSDIHRFMSVRRILSDPETVFERITSGKLSMSEADALRRGRPEFYEAVRVGIIENLPELDAGLDFKKKAALSIYFGMPVDSVFRRSLSDALQANFDTQPQQQPDAKGFNNMKRPEPTPAQRAGNSGE